MTKTSSEVPLCEYNALINAHTPAGLEQCRPHMLLDSKAVSVGARCPLVDGRIKQTQLKVDDVRGALNGKLPGQTNTARHKFHQGGRCLQDLVLFKCFAYLLQNILLAYTNMKLNNNNVSLIVRHATLKWLGTTNFVQCFTVFSGTRILLKRGNRLIHWKVACL